MRCRRLVLLLVLLGWAWTPAQAADWTHNNKIQPGENRNYLWTGTEASSMLDARRCGTIAFSYEDDIDGSNTTALASLYACPKIDSVKADCTLHTAFTDDTLELKSIFKPGFWLIDDITAPTASGVARISAFCGSQIAGGGGSSIGRCNISVESAETDDDVMCGKATSDYTLQSLKCKATGSPVTHKVEVFECNTVGAVCTTVTGLDVTMTNSTDEETETPGGNDVIEEDNWFRLDTVSLGTPSAWLHCQIEYTEG